VAYRPLTEAFLHEFRSAPPPDASDLGGLAGHLGRLVPTWRGVRALEESPVLLGEAVVAEWARRHGQPVMLHLTGLAGGRFASGDGGQELTLDAVEFCRILSGRAEGSGLLAQEAPF
jgi:hypothetical protein